MALDIKKHSTHFSTAPQIQVDDVEVIAKLGFKTIINNRPDGEGGPDQALSSDVQRAAESLGLKYVYLPVVSGRITDEQIDEFAEHLSNAPQPILAYCRSGTRSTNLYQMAMLGQK